MAYAIFQITPLTAVMFLLPHVLCLPFDSPENHVHIDVKRPAARSRMMGVLAARRWQDRNWYQDEELPWICPEVTDLVDLGMDRYPRYIREVRCPNVTCNHGHNHCTATVYNIKVLARNVNHTRHQLVPVMLQQDWTFVNRDVITGCVCGV